uniref:Uncharacterized protein n=1 Tax=Rhizophora mucronata TaxID=61149 RepID=A0A2P2KUV4_RHIMU
MVSRGISIVPASPASVHAIDSFSNSFIISLFRAPFVVSFSFVSMITLRFLNADGNTNSDCSSQ